jgi:hypothetical protein
VQAAAQEVREQLAAEVAQFSDRELAEPHFYPWRHGEPLARNYLIDTYWHPEMHLAALYRELGHHEQAGRLERQLEHGLELPWWIRSS